MADVFISYHVESAGKIVGQIASALENAGISCWYAARDVYAGNCVGIITRAIRECKVFLLILNRDALKSRYVESEVALAYRRMMNYEKLTFLPVCVDDCDWKETHIAFYLRHTQMMNGVALPVLCQRVARIVGGKSSRRPVEAEKNRVAENL